MAGLRDDRAINGPALRHRARRTSQSAPLPGRPPAHLPTWIAVHRPVRWTALDDIQVPPGSRDLLLAPADADNGKPATDPFQTLLSGVAKMNRTLIGLVVIAACIAWGSGAKAQEKKAAVAHAQH